MYFVPAGSSLPQSLGTADSPTFAGVLFADGNAGAPSITFSADTDTGFYRPAANTLDYSAGGARALRFGINSGTGDGYIGFGAFTAWPYITSTHTDNNNTGMAIHGGVSGADTTLFSIDVTAGVAVATFAGRVTVPAGTAALPSLNFTGDTTTGFLLSSAGAHHIGIAQNGSQNGRLEPFGTGGIYYQNGNGTGCIGFNSTGTICQINGGAISVNVGLTTSAVTDWLINPATKTSGNFCLLQINSSDKFKVDYTGKMTTAAHAAIGAVETGFINDSTNTVSAITIADTIGRCTFVASTTGGASLRVPHGTAPSSPGNGDIWTTTAGLFVQINGVTKTVTLS